MHRAANQLKRKRGGQSGPRRMKVPSSQRQMHRVQIWQGGDPEWAFALRKPDLPPEKLCLTEQPDACFRFFETLRSASSAAFKKKQILIDRNARPNGFATIPGYVDFSYPSFISTAAAVILASEFERLSKAHGEVTPTVDLDRWNPDVFRKLYQIGFFEIVGITPKRHDVVIDEGDTRTMQIIGTKNANDLEQVDNGIQNLCNFVNPDGEIPDDLIINLLTGLAEAIANVTGHAYPNWFNPEYPHINQLWIAATADRARKTLTVVVYDQGVTIPVTYPRMKRRDKVMTFLARALRGTPEFDFQNDGTYIRAAMRYGGSRTDQRHRGKGLPQIVEVVSRSGRGKLSVFSRGGWCIRNSDGRLRSGAVSSSIGGTLVEWVLELSPASVVADQ